MESNPLANALHGEAQAGVQPSPRSISIEDNVLHQIDRIGYLRSIGEAWDEPVFHLRDICVGLEDEEFWDGIPKQVRERKNPPITDVEKKAYNDRGWETMEVRMRVMKIGKHEMRFLDPTASELSLMLRILMALLARRGMTWKRRTIDEIPMTFGVNENDQLPT